MKGGHLHDVVLLGRLRREFENRAACVRLQVPCRLDSGRGFIDMVVTLTNRVLAIEAELTSRRVENDIRKARSIDADELWIVVPNPSVLVAARRALRRVEINGHQPNIFLATLSQSLQQVAHCFPLSMCEREKRKRNPAEP